MTPVVDLSIVYDKNQKIYGEREFKVQKVPNKNTIYL